MDTSTFKVSEAIALLGGVSALARRFGVTPYAVCKWRKRLPAERCIEIEKALLGAIRCEEMRPDIDWGYLRAHP